MKTLLKFSFLLFLIIFLNCWERQENQTTAPEIPYYTLSGNITDIDSGELLSGCYVNLSAVQLIYTDAEFDGATDTTDNAGAFEFKGITPGQYNMIIKRDQVDVLTKAIVVEHADKIVNLESPKALIAYEKYEPNPSITFTGFCWIASQTLAAVGMWQEHADDVALWKLVTGDFNRGLEVLGPGSDDPNPSSWGLTYLVNYWTAGSSTTGPKIYALNSGNGYLQGETSVPFPIRDLTSDGSHLWATVSVGKIYQFSSHPSVIENEYDYHLGNPAGIAWDGEVIWVNDSHENLVFKYDENMNVRSTYCPVYIDYAKRQFTVNGIDYMAFDFGGNLWASDGYDLYVFEF